MAKTKGRAAVQKQNEALGALEVTYVAVDQIKPNQYNPNRQSEQDFQLLMKSMEEDGFTQPVVALKITEAHFEEDPSLQDHYDPGDTVIVDGEHRWRASARLGYEEIPLVYVPMSVAQARIATLRHNRARGSEDMELSAQVLRDLQELGAMEWAQDSLQLSDAEINRLVEDIPAPEGLAGDEFGQAWEPQKGGEDSDAQLSDRRTNSTPAAVEAQRDTERRMQEAKTEEERQAVRRDAGTFRLALAWSNEEAKVVKAILGRSPASGVVDLCKAELERRGISADEELAQQEQEEAAAAG